MNPACLKIREDILKISNSSGHGHIPTCFSIVELLNGVYSTMKHDPKNPGLKDRDYFFLSKGHAALGHYCVLSHFGYFPIEKVYAFGAFLSDFGCHADRHKVPGIEASTGSLGHGIGIAVGTALGLQLKDSAQKVFCIIGDGEANEGTVWESVMVAVNLKLNNLTVIYDNNQSHSRGLQIKNPLKIFEAFGCEATEVDGHDVTKINDVLSKKQTGFRAVVANTKKGLGCPSLVSGHHEWHRRSPNKEELKSLLEELHAQAV